MTPPPPSSSPTRGEGNFGRYRKLLFTVFVIAMTLGIAWTDVSAEERAAAVAGQFYPADPAVLEKTVDHDLAQAPSHKLSGRLIGTRSWLV